MIDDPIQLMLKAASYAARKHSDQRRADGMTPYFAHVARVTLITRHLFRVNDQDVLTATLLHDVIEDTNTDHDEIAEIFGMRVAKYVILLTKNKMLSKKLREKDYERRLKRAPEAIQIAKLADAFDNLSDRVGTTKLPKTLETAKKWLVIFKPTLKSPSGKLAHRKLGKLVEQVEALNNKPGYMDAPRRS
ncbi:MAG TPA: HD domain-containing protein [Chthoniobacteraceae bacterium]|nr:HD domain-containing protein [Chthoniobacteraceae bacterium]